MIILLISLIIVCCLMLVGIVLLQKSKNEGGNPMESAGTSQLFGVTKGSDVLETTTWILAILIISLSFFVTIKLTQNLKNSQNYISPNVEAALNNEILSQSIQDDKNSSGNKPPEESTK